jgi:hypothetical protein
MFRRARISRGLLLPLFARSSHSSTCGRPWLLGTALADWCRRQSAAPTSEASSCRGTLAVLAGRVLWKGEL